MARPPPVRSAFRYAAYGDSITKGYYASGGIVDTYPDQVARKKGWSVVNMGYDGKTTVPSDRTAVGLLGGAVSRAGVVTVSWLLASEVLPALSLART